MAFSIMEIFWMLLEVLRPLLPFLIVLIIINAILLVMALKRGTLTSSGAIRLAALFGGLAAVVTFFGAPAFTNSGFAELSGALDYLSLIGGALGIGVAVALLSWPPAALFQRS